MHLSKQLLGAGRPLLMCDPWYDFAKRGKKPTVRRIFNRLRRVIEREKLEDESFSIFPSLAKYDHENGGMAPDSPCGKTFRELMPQYRCVACFAVEGSNEGHYIHVELLGWDDKNRGAALRELVFIGKTFRGRKHAQALASRLAELLGA